MKIAYLLKRIWISQKAMTPNDVSALYSRNVAPFWDLQAGVRYSEDKNNSNSDRVDGVIGVLGLAPYFFETQAYLYGGKITSGGQVLKSNVISC